MKHLFLAVLVLAGFAASGAEFRMNRLFSDHMMLQRDQPAVFFGFAPPNSKITVAFAGKSAECTADAEGKWRAQLPAFPAGGPFEAQITCGEKSIVLKDILLGDIWFCSGQSNMEMRLEEAMNPEKEIAAANDPLIRLLHVPKIGSHVAIDELMYARPWTLCTPETARIFSAPGYFFARELRRELKIPIGLINAGWGGAPIGHFVPRENRGQTAEDAKTKVAVEVLRQYDAALLKAIAFEKNTEEQKKRSAVDYPDSDWEKFTFIKAPKQKNLDQLCGIFQLRKTITLPEKWAGRDLVLRLGHNNYADRTYFNGEFVAGRSGIELPLQGKWDRNRIYVIPGKLVRTGANTLSIFWSEVEQGGLYGKFTYNSSGVSADISIAPKDEAAAAMPLLDDWKLQSIVELPRVPRTYGSSYNAMILPITRFPVKGAIWYQGESNAQSPWLYAEQFEKLAAAWRAEWNNPTLPIYAVQLAAHGAKRPNSLAEMREVQRELLDKVPYTGLATAVDIGDRGNIHPVNKQEVGRRLALLALNRTYGKKNIVDEGPLFDRAEYKEGKLLIHFRPNPSPLKVKGAKLSGFEIAGADGVYRPASAVIHGKTVELRSPDVPVPANARYLWDNVPEATLYNEADLPAFPFTTNLVFETKK